MPLQPDSARDKCIDATAQIVGCAIESGKLQSVEPEAVAKYFSEVYSRIYQIIAKKPYSVKRNRISVIAGSTVTSSGTVLVSSDNMRTTNLNKHALRVSSSAVDKVGMSMSFTSFLVVYVFPAFCFELRHGGLSEAR